MEPREDRDTGAAEPERADTFEVLVHTVLENAFEGTRDTTEDVSDRLERRSTQVA